MHLPEMEKFEKPVSPRPSVSFFVEVNGVSCNRSAK